MSDPKRANLITVGAPKSAKNNVKKTVRLTINLVESNECKYPELNYKELVIAEERRKRVENGKTRGLDPFSDNDEDVERLTRKFEQKYGGKSTYGRKGRSKTDDFADIGAGYDESDSFIDNTDGYDEMIPPECDTIHGGFYINCGSLEFKSVPENQAVSDAEPANRRNKRRISSSSSEEESSDTSSASESHDEKDIKPVANGAVDSHKTEHRKKKNKNIEKKIAKKIRRTDSSAATSGKQTSDDNAQGEGESVDSRTSHSDSLTSKPAPSSENAITSDSSRDAETKVEVELPPSVAQVLEALEAAVSKQLMDTPSTAAKELLSKTEQYAIRLERVLSKSAADSRVCRGAWNRAAKALATTRSKLLQRVKSRLEIGAADGVSETPAPATATIAQTTTASATTVTSSTTSHKRKQEDEPVEDFSRLTDDERDAQIAETLQRLKALIDERKPGMIANYNAECERVQEERKKIQIASAAEGAPHIEKRLPKRRFPWCPRTRALLSRLKRLARDQESAAALLAKRALPLFPSGFVRMPTLLRQADLSKEIKVSEIKRQRLGSASQPPLTQPTPAFPEPIQFPSSLTVTTTMKTSPDKTDLITDDKYKSSLFDSMLNSFNLGKDITVEKPEKKDTEKSKEELYIPPNNIGSITITPVLNQPKPEKKTNDKGLIRVKSPAALNEMVKKDKQKKDKDKNHVKDKRLDTPLHINTNHQSKDTGPKSAEIPQKQIECMRNAENNLPRPALVPVHHSPTFAKPDKRPPEVKKKKEIVIISDVDPLADNAPEPVAIDDSSSDVEVVEEKSDKTEVPLKDKCQKKVSSVKSKSVKAPEHKSDAEEPTSDDIDTLMRNIREMEHSQETTKFNSSSYGGLNNAKHEKSSNHAYNPRSGVFGDSRSDKDKFAEPTSLKRTDGCNSVADTAAMEMIKS